MRAEWGTWIEAAPQGLENLKKKNTLIIFQNLI